LEQQERVVVLGLPALPVAVLVVKAELVKSLEARLVQT
jgi:hypothetical protein